MNAMTAMRAVSATAMRAIRGTPPAPTAATGLRDGAWRVLLWWLALLVGTGAVLRGVLAADLLAHTPGLGGEVLRTFVVGAANDLVAAWLLAVPMLLPVLVPLARGRVPGPAARRTAQALLGLLVFLHLLVLAAEPFFWIEFQSRINRLVFHYLEYPVEVVTFLDEQFGLVVLLTPLLVLTWLLARTPLRWLARVQPSPGRRRWLLPAMLGTAGVLALPVLQHGPLRPSELRRVNEVGNNGYLWMLHGAVFDTTRWAGQYPSLGPDRERVAGALLAQPEPAPPRLRAPRLRHVVLVIEESFGGESWVRPELRALYMPRIAALAADGLHFGRIRATGTRTTRGMEAILHAWPPLPGNAVTQRRGFERLPSLPRALAAHGFASVFVYGGWGSFTDFADYWRGIGFAEVLTRDDFAERRFETSWGVSDEELFTRVLAEMDRRTGRDERVFLATLTVSNHRPFDYPAGRVRFDPAARRSQHAIAYADWALGDFVERARSRPWFDDTLFVFVADHGPIVNGDTVVPVEGYGIPLVLYAPGALPAARIDAVGSNASVAPTVLGVLGLGCGGQLFRAPDLTRPAPGGGYALVEHDYAVGMLDDAGLVVLVPNGPAQAWRMDEGSGALGATRPDPARVRTVAAAFESAHQWFYGADPGAAQAAQDTVARAAGRCAAAPGAVTAGGR